MNEKGTLNKLKQKEREVRKNIIIDAAERVFAAKPFDSVGMKEIANEAGIATSSIYTYFPNQETLFIETCLRDLDSLIEILSNIIEKEKHVKVGDVINAYIDYFTKHDSFFRMMTNFILEGNLNPESIQKLSNKTRDIVNLFDNIFQKLNYSKDIRILSHYLLSVLNGILITYRRFPGKSVEESVSHMKNIGKILENMILNTRP